MFDSKHDYMIEPGSFEARVREEVLRLLRSPLSLPPEFRSWLVPFIESSNVQIPISQIVGNFLVAEHARELGGDVPGRPGMLRVGSSPYDFFPLTYDAVYGKWVSDFQVLASVEGGKATASTSYQALGNGEAPAPSIPWGDFDTAGLKPQYRLIALLANDTAGGTATATMIFESFNDNDAIVGGTAAAWSVAVTGTSPRLRSSGWQDIPSLTARAFLLSTFALKSSSGANLASMGSSTSVQFRWVSK